MKVILMVRYLELFWLQCLISNIFGLEVDGANFAEWYPLTFLVFVLVKTFVYKR